MTDLQTQAREYAECIMKGYYPFMMFTHKDVCDFIAQAYIQGWVDRDTHDMKPETQDEFLNGE